MRWKITYPQIVLVYFACMFRVFPLLFKCGIFYCNWLVTCLPPQIDCKQQKPNNAKWLPWGHIIRRESQNGNQAPLIHGPLCCSLAAGLRVLKSLFLRRNRGESSTPGLRRWRFCSQFTHLAKPWYLSSEQQCLFLQMMANVLPNSNSLGVHLKGLLYINSSERKIERSFIQQVYGTFI